MPNTTPHAEIPHCEAVHASSGDRCERPPHEGTLHVRPGGRTWRTSEAAALPRADAPMWKAWKRHLIGCADCTAGEVCAEGRGYLGSATPEDAPWLTAASARPQGAEDDRFRLLVSEAREHIGYANSTRSDFLRAQSLTAAHERLTKALDALARPTATPDGPDA